MTPENKKEKRWQDTDLTDSPSDEARLQGDTAVLELPDVSDIPGQENVHPAPLGPLADTTISSDDEEGPLTDKAGFEDLSTDEDADTMGIP